MMRRRPLLGLKLMRDAVCDRLGCHRDSPEVHLLDVLRFAARMQWSTELDDEDRLHLSAPSESRASRFRLRMGDSDVRVFREVIAHEAYRDALAGMVGGRTDPWIIDAGANVGLSTLYIKSRFPNARVVALEPDRDNVEQMRWHLANNGCGDVRVVEAALWPERTRLRFVGAGESLPSWGLRVEPGEDGPVAALSPMDLIREHGIDQVDLLKLDVEGSEFPLFSAPDAATWLARVRSIIAEFHPEFGNTYRIVEVLIRAGFDVRDLGGNILLAIRRD